MVYVVVQVVNMVALIVSATNVGVELIKVVNGTLKVTPFKITCAFPFTVHAFVTTNWLVSNVQVLHIVIFQAVVVSASTTIANTSVFAGMIIVSQFAFQISSCGYGKKDISVTVAVSICQILIHWWVVPFMQRKSMPLR
jgi:hypothetical protein